MWISVRPDPWLLCRRDIAHLQNRERTFLQE